MRMYADRKGFDLGQVNVKLDYIREKDGGRITLEVSVSRAITEEQRARLADIIERTPVTLAIKQGVGIASTVSVTQPAQ
jgi:putative redox protein